MSSAYCTEVQQGRGPRQQQQTKQQMEPGQAPDWQTPQQPPLLHLSTLCCEQSQLGGRVTAHPTRLAATHKEDQGVEEGQKGHRQDGEGEEGHRPPATLLTASHQQQESNTDQQRGQLVMAQSIQEDI